MSIKADLHTHTAASFDGRQTLRELTAAAKKAGLDAVAVTEHIQFQPLPEHMNGILLIPGCEFYTDAGHVTGLFLTQPPTIKTRQTAREAIDEIHRCGGIAVLAHPYQNTKERILPPGFDAIETANARADYKQKGANARAVALAEQASLPTIGGSDAHSPREVGNAYTEFSCAECTLTALKEAILRKDCKAVLRKNTPHRMIGLSQLTRRRKMGGLKNLCIGLLFLIKCTLKDIKEN